MQSLNNYNTNSQIYGNSSTAAITGPQQANSGTSETDETLAQTRASTSTVAQQALADLPLSESQPDSEPLTPKNVTSPQQTPIDEKIKKVSFILENCLVMDAELRDNTLFVSSQDNALTESVMSKHTGLGTLVGEDGGVVVGNWEDGKQRGYVVSVSELGARYKGYWADGEMSGYGVFEFKNGGKLEGNWKDGKQNGYGIMTFSNGGSYKGNWKDGKKSGYGVNVFPYGGKYEGNWENGEQSGYGILVFTDGSRYEGNWENGKESGYGFLRYGNGDTYRGYWVERERSGYGVLVSKNTCDSYKGDWVNGKYSGYGIRIYSNDHKYEGKWKNNKRNGLGVLLNRNGDRYEGNWVDEEQSGYGVYIFKNGYRIEGNWVDGKGQATLSHNNVVLYTGEFTNQLPTALPLLYLQAMKRKVKTNSSVEITPFQTLEAKEWQEMCKEAIKNSETIFKKNKDKSGFIAKIEALLTEEQREKKKESKEQTRKAGLKELLDLKQKGKAVSKAGPSKQAVQSSSKQASSSSSSSSSAPSPLAMPTSLNGPTLGALNLYKSHPRIRRWANASKEQIKAFEDTVNGARIKKYELMSDGEIDLWQMRHHLPQVERIVAPENNGLYYTVTERGFRLMATLTRCGEHYYAEHGDVFLGMDQTSNVIFHKMFTPWRNPDDFESLFQSPVGLPESNAGADDAPWEAAGECAWEIHADGSIEFNYETHKLLIHRLQ